ncbi:MAG: universal stress protein [Candidatus Xenobia bacterium]
MSYLKIMVPTDLSELSQHALPMAIGLGGSLLLVHVHTIPVTALMAYGVQSDTVMPVDPVQDKYLLQSEQAELELLAARCPVPSRGIVVRPAGDVVESLRAQAEANHVDLIVMSTHGRGPLSRFWLGSVADGLIRVAPCPVLTVRPSVEVPNLDLPYQFGSILVPLDGSALSEQILEPALRLATEPDAVYHLLHVCSIDASIKQAQAYLDRQMQHCEKRGYRAVPHLRLGEAPANVILRVATEVSADAIALQTRGLSGLSRIRLGAAPAGTRRRSVRARACQPLPDDLFRPRHDRIDGRLTT